MRLGDNDNHFDLSDAGLPDLPPIDRLDGALDVAASVLRDYGPDPGNTRIERLARYVSLNLGDEPCLAQAGAVTHWVVSFPRQTRPGVPPLEGRVDVWRVGEHVGLQLDVQNDRSVAALSPDLARAVAIALLRAAERAER